jgi:hypothetical protein
VVTFLVKKLSIIKFIFKTVFFTIGFYCQVLVHTWELMHNHPIHTWARGQLGEQGGPGKASIHYYQLLNLRTNFSLKSPKES